MDKDTRVIFLDIDGVLNCQIFYESEQSREARKECNKDTESNSTYWRSMICRDRVSWLNQLCEDTGSVVVISSTWRGSGIDYCRQALTEAGATFDIIDVTPHLRHEGCLRGNEIYHWIDKNSTALFGVSSYDFRNYVIIDDDSDMLLWQAEHFFKTDSYSGLTPNTCYKITQFFSGIKNRETFPKINTSSTLASK